MTMTFVRDHGTWSTYTPDVIPSGYMPNALFSKNDVTHIDWYAYRKAPASFQANTLKLTLLPNSDGDWIVHSCFRDASFAFPQGGARLVEFDDGSTDEVEPWAFNDKVYDLTAHTLADPAPPQPTPVDPATLVASPRQLRLALNQLGLRDQVEAYVDASTQDVKDSWLYSTEFPRSYPMTIDCAKALRPDDYNTLLDQIFELAVTL